MFNLLRLIVIILILYFLYQGVRRLFLSDGKQKPIQGDERAKQVRGEDLVEDPQCHMYVPVSRAIEKRIGDRTLHFCSEACYRAYQESTK
jgi:YHS domain-containing protein